ncbi:MAG TPA: hypothetical protein PLQ35_16135 [bacterium]|mgnify:CR=1 FL=1|nr:hypothetical protein [bacterium]
MKISRTLLFCASLLTTPWLVSAQQAPAPVDIASVSARLELAPGLRILDAYVFPFIDENHDLQTETGDIVSSDITGNLRCLTITPSLMIFTGLSYKNPQRPSEVQCIVYSYHIAKGARTLARTVVRGWPASEDEAHHIGFNNRILLVYLWDRNAQKHMIVRITGDWESLGLDIPSASPTATPTSTPTPESAPTDTPTAVPTATPGNQIIPTMGTAFTYQGHLMESGNPANGVYDLEFKLYDAEIGGTQIAESITLDDVTVAGGLFKVDLDFGEQVFDGEARFAQIGVRGGANDGAYTAIGTRQRLNPTPYAIYSLSAGSARSISGVRAQAAANNEISTNSTEWVDMEGMSLNVTTGNRPVLILFTAGGIALEIPLYVQIRSECVKSNETAPFGN